MASFLRQARQAIADFASPDSELEELRSPAAATPALSAARPRRLVSRTGAATATSQLAASQAAADYSNILQSALDVVSDLQRIMHDETGYSDATSYRTGSEASSADTHTFSSSEAASQTREHRRRDKTAHTVENTVLDRSTISAESATVGPVQGRVPIAFDAHEPLASASLLPAPAPFAAARLQTDPPTLGLRGTEAPLLSASLLTFQRGDPSVPSAGTAGEPEPRSPAGRGTDGDTPSMLAQSGFSMLPTTPAAPELPAYVAGGPAVAGGVATDMGVVLATTRAGGNSSRGSAGSEVPVNPPPVQGARRVAPRPYVSPPVTASKAAGRAAAASAAPRDEARSADTHHTLGPRRHQYEAPAAAPATAHRLQSQPLVAGLASTYLARQQGHTDQLGGQASRHQQQPWNEEFMPSVVEAWPRDMAPDAVGISRPDAERQRHGSPAGIADELTGRGAVGDSDEESQRSFDDEEAAAGNAGESGGSSPFGDSPLESRSSYVLPLSSAKAVLISHRFGLGGGGVIAAEELPPSAAAAHASSFVAAASASPHPAGSTPVSRRDRAVSQGHNDDGATSASGDSSPERHSAPASVSSRHHADTNDASEHEAAPSTAPRHARSHAAHAARSGVGRSAHTQQRHGADRADAADLGHATRFTDADESRENERDAQHDAHIDETRFGRDAHHARAAQHDEPRHGRSAVPAPQDGTRMTLDELLRSPMDPGRAAAEGVPLDASGRPVFEHTLDASFGSSRGSSGSSAVEEAASSDRGGGGAVSRKRRSQAGRSPHALQAVPPGTLQRSMHDAALATLRRQRQSPQELPSSALAPAPQSAYLSTPPAPHVTASRSPQAHVADPAAVVARAAQLGADIERSSLLFQQLAGDRAAAAGYTSPSPGSGRGGSSSRGSGAEQRWRDAAAESAPAAAALLASPSRSLHEYAEQAPFGAPSGVRQSGSRSAFAPQRSPASPPQPYSGEPALQRWRHSGDMPEYGSDTKHTLGTSSPGGQRANTERDTPRRPQPPVEAGRQPAEAEALGRAARQSFSTTAAGFRAAAPQWSHTGEVFAAATAPIRTASAGAGGAGGEASNGAGIDLTAASRTTSAILDGLHESVLLLRAARHPALQGAQYPLAPLSPLYAALQGAQYPTVSVAPASLHRAGGSAPSGATHAAAPPPPVSSGTTPATYAAPTHRAVATSASAGADDPAPAAAALRARAAADRDSLLQQLPHNRYAAAAWSGQGVAALAAPQRRPTGAVITLPARPSRNQHAATAGGGSAGTAAPSVGPYASDSSTGPVARSASAATRPRLQAAAPAEPSLRHGQAPPATSRFASAQAGYVGALLMPASGAAVASSSFSQAHAGTRHDARWSRHGGAWSGLPSPQAGWAAYQRHVAVSAR